MRGIVDPWGGRTRGIKGVFTRNVAFAVDRIIPLWLPSIEAAKKVEDSSLDFVFIDANHHYEHVVQDMIAWYPKVRSGGLFSGHDYGGGRVWHGVKRAVNEWCALRGYEVQTARGNIWWVIKGD